MNNTENTLNPLAQDFHLFSLLKFAFPSIIMMIFMGLYTLMDTIFVSNFVNTNAMSAINIVCPVINIIVGLATMIATGSSAIIARKMGTGAINRAKQDFTFIVLVSFFLGIIISILGIVCINPIIWGLGANETLFSYSKEYLLILFLFTPASMLQIVFQSLTVTAGKPKIGLIISIGSGLINIALDYLFIVVFNMGIAGSALGTGIGYVIASTIGIIFFIRNKGTLTFSKPIFDGKMLKESCLNGSSEMVSQISTAITTFFFNATMMKLLGENGVAAITIVIYTQFLLTSLYIGFSMGVAPIFSFHHGSQNNVSLKRIFAICLTWIGIASIAIFSIAIFTNDALIQLFVAKGTEVYLISQKGFSIFAISFLFCGFNIFTSAFFTALSNGKMSAIISFSRTFVFIMIGLLVFPSLWHVIGVWLAVPIAEILTFILSLFLLLNKKHQYHYA